MVPSSWASTGTTRSGSRPLHLSGGHLWRRRVAPASCEHEIPGSCLARRQPLFSGNKFRPCKEQENSQCMVSVPVKTGRLSFRPNAERETPFHWFCGQFPNRRPLEKQSTLANRPERPQTGSWIGCTEQPSPTQHLSRNSLLAEYNSIFVYPRSAFFAGCCLDSE